MPTLILVSVVSITAALVFYTVAVWMNFFAKELRPLHVGLFVCGMITDVAATSMMAASIEGRVTWDLHTISGYTALVLMLLVTSAGLFATFRKHAWLLGNFHRISIPVWCVWMVSWITGVVLGLQKV